jgi:hypothetical protein
VHNLDPPARSPIVSPPPSLQLKRRRDREIDLENRRELLSLLGVAFPSLLIHGRVGLDRVSGHARAHAKPCDSGVYDGGGACDLPHARGSCNARSGGGIRRGVCSIL